MTCSMQSSCQFNLQRSMFTAEKTSLLESLAGQVATFRYSSGVEALQVTTDRVDAIVLPYRGQQIWRLLVDGENVTMQTSFPEPVATDQFSETYGSFLLHCGLTGVGAPGPEDQHSHHGELPFAIMEDVSVAVVDVEGTAAIEVSGIYRYRKTHSFGYRTRIWTRFTAGESIVRTGIEVMNLRHEPLEFSYLCHVNWRFDQPLEIVEASDPASVDFHPAGSQSEETAQLLAKYQANPHLSSRVDPVQEIVPEYCAIVTHSPTIGHETEVMGMRADGSAFYVRYDLTQLPRSVRWITNTPDEQAAGISLPTTGHHLGRQRNQVDGLLVRLGAEEKYQTSVAFGVLSAEEAVAVRKRIAAA